MKEYELIVILHPDLEIDQDKPLSKIEKIITSQSGVIANRDDWGKRKLAYPIKKQLFGLYFVYELELTPESVAEIEHNLTITSEVLRHLLVKREEVIADEVDKKPSTTKKEAKTKATAAKKEEYSPAKTSDKGTE